MQPAGERPTRETVFFDESLCFGIRGDRTRGSWYYGNPDLNGCETDGENNIDTRTLREWPAIRTDVPSLGLISERINDFRGGPDECKSSLFYLAREFRVFRQEAISDGG
jgi:hypothetical protein